MLERLRHIREDLALRAKTYRAILKDSRTPLLPKLLLALAIGYAVLPIDIIPDFIPVIGHLDDAVIIPALVYIALKMVPEEVIEDCKRRALG